jgi:hypothetical protein
MKITMEFARQDDCLDKMVPSDLRQLIGDKERAEAERDALAAQVEVLQSWLRQVAELINLDGGTAIDWLIDTHQEMLSAAKSTPAACLAQVRAEAGRAGFVAGAEWWAKCELEDTLHLDEQSAADRWAESIWKGGLE